MAHPVIPGFDRLSATAKSEAEIAQSGLLLLAELNCTACHTPPHAWSERLSSAPAPDLAGVGSRLNAGALRRMISDPQQCKVGTRMPRMFGGAGNDAARIDLLVDYLASLQEPVGTMPDGDAGRGKELYHSVGCVACHAPAQSAGQNAIKPSDASVPIALAREYDLRALGEFLHDPLRVRPSGRMPSMRLNVQEAADIARYLQQEGAVKLSASKGAPDRIAGGREIFNQQRCSACHSTGEKAFDSTAPALASLAADRGCLAPAPPTGTPHFALSKGQRRALSVAIASVKSAPSPQTAAQKIDWQFTRLNCYACHVRAGQGGPDPVRAAYFTVNDPGAESLGEMAHLPPLLDRVGRKLTVEWFAKILWGEDGAVRPYTNTRMPDFGRAQTEPLIAWFEEADALAKPVQINVSGLLGHHRAEPGRKLLGAGGLACVSCHGLKDRKSLGPPVARLTFTAQRLRPEYFKELLLDPQATQPGTVMPPLFTGRKDAAKEIETIWTYLREIDGQPLPEGLFSNDDYELKPAIAGHPVVLRSFIEGAGTHAIGIGFPQGLNATFDAKSCRWTQIWKGRYLDAMSNFQDRAMKPIKPLGTDVRALPDDGAARDYRGYRVSRDGVPTFLYQRDGRDVEDTLRPTADGKSFERIVRANGGETKEVLSW
ncbi:MAG: c-type cytochrome [Chthoniobacteraceae bacterium]